jgi:hypothetical protein
MGEEPDLSNLNGSRPEETPWRGFARVEELLRTRSIWEDLPAGLEQRVLAGTTGSASEASGNVIPLHRRAAGPRFRRARQMALVAAVAGLVATAGGAAAARLGSGDRQVELAGTSLAESAHAQAHLRETVSGVEITLDISRLPAAPTGTFYQGWVKGDRGSVAIGTFHLRRGSDDVVLWSGVKLSDYPKVTVTLQTEGAGPASSGKVVLTGEVPQKFR